MQRRCILGTDWTNVASTSFLADLQALPAHPGSDPVALPRQTGTVRSGREAFAARDGKLAFQCGDSIAADELLHKVLVFDGDKQVAAVSSCRKPRWTGPAALVCSSESVAPDGKIKLRAKKVSLGR